MDGLQIKNGIVVSKENERLEFKSALKGIPGSVWETYSSFANSFGGTIVLGINDATHELEGVPHPELRIQELWNSLNNPQVVNRNMLFSDSIRTYEADGKTLIVMDVPRADRCLRPVYYKSMETGTFKRNGEGDYRCNMEEVSSMLRDNTASSYDSTLLEGTSFKDIDLDSLRSYRNEMRTYNPDHMWNGCSDEEFASVIGAVGHSSDRLTVAGLLMFGREDAIYAYMPRFKLDYIERPRAFSNVWTYRLVTGDGLWNGNVYNFFCKVRGRISSDLDRPLEIGPDMRRVDDTDLHKAVRECLLNSLIHADYLGRLVVKIEKDPDSLTFMNSGLFRIPLETAEKGGESDPRNSVMARMFSMIGLVERAGSGLSYVFRTWKDRKGMEPVVTEDTDKQRVKVELFLRGKDSVSVGEMMIDIITDDPTVTASELASMLGVSLSTVKNNLRRLKESGAITRVGSTRGYWVTSPGFR